MISQLYIVSTYSDWFGEQWANNDNTFIVKLFLNMDLNCSFMI